MRHVALPVAVWVVLTSPSCTTTETVIVSIPPDGPGPVGSGDVPAPSANEASGGGADPGAAGAAYTVPCPADLAAAVEAEPNDHWTSSNPLGTVAAPGTCVQGRVLCGNDGKDGYANPGDHFALQVSAPTTATFSLKWLADADFDLLVSDDFDGGKLAVTFASGKGAPEGGKATLQPGTTYYVSINCWEGTPGDFALSVRW